MKIVKLICPACGANIDSDGKMMFCSYCGAKLFVDDEAINININYTKHDEARIRDSERKEKVRLKELEYEARKNRHDDKVALFCVGLLFSIAIVCVIISIIFTQIEKPSQNEVAIPMSSNEYEGDNYSQVLSELENAGFMNVQLVEKADLVTGWITKEGDVERVSINGDYDFDAGDVFPKDAKVIITYHTFQDK